MSALGQGQMSAFIGGVTVMASRCLVRDREVDSLRV
jgi:hypothetical protein